MNKTLKIFFLKKYIPRQYHFVFTQADTDFEKTVTGNTV